MWDSHGANSHRFPRETSATRMVRTRQVGLFVAPSNQAKQHVKNGSFCFVLCRVGGRSAHMNPFAGTVQRRVYVRVHGAKGGWVGNCPLSIASSQAAWTADARADGRVLKVCGHFGSSVCAFITHPPHTHEHFSLAHGANGSKAGQFSNFAAVCSG